VTFSAFLIVLPRSGRLDRLARDLLVERIGRHCREAADAETGVGLAAGLSPSATARAPVLRAIAIRADADILRLMAIAAGLAWGEVAL
jgi:hypothetical protein